MKINGNKTALKGQHILAQGKRSGALGWIDDSTIVRETTLKREKILSRTKWSIANSQEIICSIPSERNYLLCSSNSRGRFFFCINNPGRRFGSFLPKLCPGLLYVGLSGRKYLRKEDPKNKANY